MLRLKRVNHQIVIDVGDTGSGIPEQEQERVFDRFYKGSIPPRIVRRSGQGLGLSIVKDND